MNLRALIDRLSGNRPEPDRQQLLAQAAAALLLEVSWADHEISADEASLMERALQDTFALDATAARAVVDSARKDLDRSVGIQAHTRLITEHWDEQARFELVRNLWRLAYADANLDRYEEHTIRRIAELLYVDHSRFIEAKLSARGAG